MHVCIYVCMYVSMYVGMYACMYACLYVCMWIFSWVCVDACGEQVMISGPDSLCKMVALTLIETGKKVWSFQSRIVFILYYTTFIFSLFILYHGYIIL